MDNNNFYAKVFGWLFVGLMITFASAYVVSTNVGMLEMIFTSSAYWFIIVAQIGICIFLTARIAKMKALTAKILYILYALLTGVTFSTLFFVFEMSSIIFVFLATAIVFGIFALIGYKTKINLSSYGTFLFVALLAIIILELINVFVMNSTVDIVLCIVGIVIFVGYIAYDMQRIKNISEEGFGNDNFAIIEAFELYLDFINLFIKLLNLFGKERD